MKICTKCEIPKELDAFSKHSGTKDGRHTACKECRGTAEKLRYIENREEILARQRVSEKRALRERRRHYKSKYDLSLEEVEELKVVQEFLCAICKKEVDLVVDHCHKSGIVRGMLCHKCNRAIGQFDDSIEKLMAAIEYLGRYR